MAKGKHQTTTLDRARDELYSHIHRCGVLSANEEQQQEWMDDTIDFLQGRYPDLSDREAKELRELGLRFCRPPILHGQDNAVVGGDDAEEDAEDVNPAMAGAGAEEDPGDVNAA
ncbi:MAG TPA: hypothetical protein VMK65_04975 [Longimicrobiales bacterium]|nr:hypothetical protein [Longimicrobiales bacterium]